MSPRGSFEQDADTAELIRFLLCAEEATLLRIAYDFAPCDFPATDSRQAYLREKTSLMRSHDGYGRLTWWLALDRGNRAAVREAALRAAEAELHPRVERYEPRPKRVLGS